MKPSEIRELSMEELREKVNAKEEELANLRFQLSLHQLDNTSKVRIERRELARLMTILNQFEQTAAKAEKAESN
ncbi:50S ribosomal protein L29 [Calditrichota bacterium]